MSYIPQSSLKPVNSLGLRTFTITESLTSKTFPYKFDSYTLYQSFCRSTTIRNLSGTAPIFYRTEPGDPFDVVPPNAERTISGWNSLVEIQEQAGTSIVGVIVYEMVKGVDAAIG